jgi:hypothetical protein
MSVCVSKEDWDVSRASGTPEELELLEDSRIDGCEPLIRRDNLLEVSWVGGDDLGEGRRSSASITERIVLVLTHRRSLQLA